VKDRSVPLKNWIGLGVFPDTGSCVGENLKFLKGIFSGCEDRGDALAATAYTARRL